MEKLIEELGNLLMEISSAKKNGFPGLGLIIYKDIEGIPVTPLIDATGLISLPVSGYQNIISTLKEISNESHSLHDGFHLISQDFILTHVSEYFSTPIIRDAKIEYNYGSRYRTALYGSFLKGIYACCIIGRNYGPLIFKEGISVWV